MKFAVKWIHQDLDRETGGHSGQKPMLCFKGKKQMLCVAAAHPVRVLKLPLSDFTECRDVYYAKEAYPVTKAAEKLAEIGSKNGITNGAARLIEHALSNNACEIDEDDFEDEEQMTSTTNGQRANTEENTLNAKSKKSKGKGNTANKGAGTNKATTAAKKAKSASTPAAGDGLGREGSVARFFNTRLLEGRTDDAVLVGEARKTFPDKKIADTYAAWYRSALKKKGLLKS